MFGLMKSAGCQNPAQPEWYRLHYCGLCKAIGQKYDQKSRLLLNYDAVFLAEVLTHLASDAPEQWDAKIRGYQCFSLPNAGQIPVSLDYAADVNMLLAQLRIQDNKVDDLEILWSIIEKIFRKPFHKIQPLLHKWNVEMQLLQHWLTENQTREQSPAPSNIQDWQSALSYYSTPTANITGYFFGLGAEAIGKPEAKEGLYQLGYRFGELIYHLDAIKDLPEDLRLGQFNPLAGYFGAQRNQEEMEASTRDYLWELSAGIEKALQELPFAEDTQKSLQGRLVLNLSRVLSGQGNTCQTPQTGIERSTLPKIRRFLGSVFSRLNPAYPGKFALSYLLFLGLFFSNKLISSVALAVQQAPERVDWSFVSAAISFPVFAYFAAKKIKKHRLLGRLKKWRDKIKKKITALKDEYEFNNVLIFLLILILVLILVLIVMLGKATRECGECCQQESSNCG